MSIDNISQANFKTLEEDFNFSYGKNDWNTVKNILLRWYRALVNIKMYHV